MKRLLSLFMALIICFCFCACETKDQKKEVSGDVPSQIVEETYYICEPEFDCCYKALTSKQKQIYKKLLKISEDMPEGYTYLCRKSVGISADVSVAFNALINDKCEIFWLPNAYTLKNITTQNKTNVYIAFNTKEHSYLVESKADKDKKLAKLDQALKQIIGQTNGMTEYQKELYFNDYICGNTDYLEQGSLNHTAYGCLIEGKALCEGYSRAFKLLCNKADIECELITGEANGESHMWNCVNIEGKHSYVDVTWNDREDDCKYLYFNITDNQLSHDHTLSPLLSTLTINEIESGKNYNFVSRVCTYTDNGYYAVNNLGLGYDYINNCAQIIKQEAKKGNEKTAVYLDTSAAKNSFEQDPSHFILSVQMKLGKILIDKYFFERDLLVLYF